MEPWKTPRVTGHQLDLTPFTTTLYAQLEKFNQRNKEGRRERKRQGTSQRERGGRGGHTDQEKEVETDKKKVMVYRMRKKAKEQDRGE